MRSLVALIVVGAAVAALAGPNADRPDDRHAWAVHDGHRPNPPQVLCEEGDVPSDAIVLFDGTEKSFEEHWMSDDGKPCKWIVRDGKMYNQPGAGFAVAKDKARDFQLHLEFMIPDPPGPGLGNTGVFVHGKYELQVLHSYFNMDKFHPAPPWKHANYADGEMGAVYGQTPPLVTACRKAGHWQVYDIVFHPSRWKDGKIVQEARVTAFLNGVLVQDDTPLEGPTFYRLRSQHDSAREIEEDAVVSLQDHGHPCPYRLIWYRPIPPRDHNHVHGGEFFNATEAKVLRTKLAAEALQMAHNETNQCNRLVFLWESYSYEPNAQVKAEIDELTPKYVKRISAWRGTLSPELQEELSNMKGFCLMAVRNGLFSESDSLYVAVDYAIFYTKAKVKGW